MKPFSFSAFSLLTMVVATTPPPNIYPEYIIVPRLGPFDLFDMEDVIEVKMTFYTYTREHVYARVTMQNENGTSYYASYSDEYDSYKTIVDANVLLSLKPFMFTTGTLMSFDVVPINNLDRTVLTSKTRLFPIGFNDINPYELYDMKYDSGTIMFEVKNMTDWEYNVTYDFKGLIDYFDETDFTTLKLNTGRFYYQGFNTFHYKDAYIRFFDSHKMFNSMKTHSDDCKHIPINLFVDDDGRVDVEMETVFYLNKITMEISEIWRNGYDLVREFYLPRNFKEVYEDYEFEVVFEDIGDDKLDVHYPLAYSDIDNFFGLCGTSKNCLTGGVR